MVHDALVYAVSHPLLCIICRDGNFADAVEEYSLAIGLCPDNPIFYSNRAAACLKLCKWAAAEQDCTMALVTYGLPDAMAVKALWRRVEARDNMGRLEGALEVIGGKGGMDAGLLGWTGGRGERGEKAVG